MSHVQNFPHGTPFASNGHANRISVASFNLLAPLYIRPIDQRTGKIQPFASFDWISDDDAERILGNECRLPRLLRSMQECGCDFICVQELQLEREKGDATGEGCDSKFVLPEWIRPLVESSTPSSYGIMVPPQTELEKIAERNRRVLLADFAITNAIFYRSDTWCPMESKDGEGDMNYSTTTCVNQAFQSAGVENGVAVDPIVITSIHLDACSEERRVQQLQRCLEQSISCSVTPYIPPCIIAGDYNCELFPGSCINAFLTDGESDLNRLPPPILPTTSTLVECERSDNRRKECAVALRLPSGTVPSEDQLTSWDELHTYVTKFIHDHLLMLDRLDTGCTRVAYDHDEDLSTPADRRQRSMAQWKLDHILYTPSTLVPLGKWATLEEDENSRKVGLPNDHIPTDHLPIAALFERCPHPQVSETSKDRLIELINSIDGMQKLALEAKLLEIEQTRSELEQRHFVEDESTDSKPQPTKKSKKKKRPPPPEIIQHIRNSRAMVKELKADQRMERRNFISERTVLERMVLQHSLGHLTCTQWIERGRG
ncbi:hypothetical protein ACHAWF_011911 [Thalassiosira exigua]